MFFFSVHSAGISGTKCVIINTKIKTKQREHRERKKATKRGRGRSREGAAADEMETRNVGHQIQMQLPYILFINLYAAQRTHKQQQQQQREQQQQQQA